MASHLSGEGPSSQPPGSDKTKIDERYRGRLRQLRAASVGWNFVTAPLVGGLFGYGIDWLISTYPWVMIAGMILGFISAFIEVLRMAR